MWATTICSRYAIELEHWGQFNFVEGPESDIVEHCLVQDETGAQLAKKTVVAKRTYVFAIMIESSAKLGHQAETDCYVNSVGIQKDANAGLGKGSS